MHRRLQRIGMAGALLLLAGVFAWAAYQETAQPAGAANKTEPQSPAPKGNGKAAEKEKGGRAGEKAKDGNAPPQTALVRVKVTGGGQPVNQASVRVTNNAGFTADRNTSSDGVAPFQNVPRGTIQIQVTAPQWRSSGKRIDVRETDQEIKFELEPL